MTPQEAIDTIKLAIAQIEWDYPMDYAAAFDMAVDALERNISVKPVPYQQETSIGFFIGFKCGDCNAVVFPDYNYRFCPMCGRRLKWE